MRMISSNLHPLGEIVHPHDNNKHRHSDFKNNVKNPILFMIDLIEIDNLVQIEFEMREIYWNYKSFSADAVAVAFRRAGIHFSLF